MFQGVRKEIGYDVRIGPTDLVRVFEVIDHAFPFLFTMFGDDDLFAVVATEIHAHTDGVSFRMELGADHGVGKSDGHNRPFEGDVWSFLFDGQDVAAHIGYALVVGLDHLEAAAVDSVEGVLETCEYGFFDRAVEKVHGEYAKGRRAPAGDFGDCIVAAD